MPNTPASVIAKLNAEAKRVETAMAKANERARLRAIKEAQTRAKRQAKAQEAREKIGTVVRKTYLQNNTVAKMLAKHGGLTPKNLLTSSTAFASMAFARAAKNETANLKKKINGYRGQWGAWYRALPNNQRVKMSREVAHHLYGTEYNNNGRRVRGYLNSGHENPFLYMSRVLNTSRPTRSHFPTSRKWQGVNHTLYYLSRPETNAILRRYGLPFSMVNVRRNLLAFRRESENSLRRRANRNTVRNVPWRTSLLYAVKQQGHLTSPPKGMKGYAGTRARRLYRARTTRY